MNQTPPDTKPQRRVGRIVTGTIITIAAIGSIAVGGVATWANAEEDDSGYITADRERFSSERAAIVSDNLDVDLDGMHWVADRVGNVHIEAENSGSKPVFVGIARTDAVERYLDGVGHSTVTDLDYGPFEVSYDDEPGRSKARPPARSPIWAESATGAGTQTVDWKIREGDWSVVVMNADGSRGVSTDVTAGVELPWLDEVAWGTVGGGIAGLAAGIALITMGYRGPRNPTATAPATSAPAPTAA